MEEKEKVLSVKDLVVSFKTDRGIVHAVRGVSFDLYKGETLCIVGESGSGKSVTNKAIIGISSANAIIENGQILYEGEDLVRVSEEEFHRIRGHKIGMIFQDPLSALNPTMRVGKQIMEATLINRNVVKKYYEEIISKELCALRNLESNIIFENKKYEDEITGNNISVKNFNKAVKKYYSTKSKFESVESLKTSAEEKDKEKYEAALENFEGAKENLISVQNKIKEYFAFTSRVFKNNIKSNFMIIEELENVREEDELKQRITEEKVERLRYLNELYGKFEEKQYLVDDDYVKALKEKNKDLKVLIKENKFLLKKYSPALKEDLKRKKKEAKELTEKYKVDVETEKEQKLASLNEKLKEVEAKILEEESKLSKEEVDKIHSILKENIAIQKKITKAQTKFKEVNVSKVSKDNELKLIEIHNETLNVLYKEKGELIKTIDSTKDEYANKTRISKSHAKKMALQVMKEVGIPLPERRFKQYPFEFSGGMRQRIVIAIALIANPDILICDEPTTALDVTIQAQILDLINKLKEERKLSCIFITHDLGVVAHMADRVAVMYAGKIVEYGTVDEIFFEPKHPYTWALLSSIPDIHSKEKLEAIPGTPPDMLYPPKGDAFALRSKYAMEIDFKYEPPYFKISDTHYAATWLLHKDAPKVEMPKIVEQRIEAAKKLDEEEEKKCKTKRKK